MVSQSGSGGSSDYTSPDRTGHYGTASSASSSTSAIYRHQSPSSHIAHALPGAYPPSPGTTSRQSGRIPNGSPSRDIDSPPILSARISPSYTSRLSPWSAPNVEGEELPYLCPSPAGSSSSSPSRSSRPVLLDGGEWTSRAGASAEAGPSTTPLSSGRSLGSPKHGHLSNKKGMKRRPSPLDLRGGGEVRVDPELQEHLDDIASAVTVVTNGE